MVRKSLHLGFYKARRAKWYKFCIFIQAALIFIGMAAWYFCLVEQETWYFKYFTQRT